MSEASEPCEVCKGMGEMFVPSGALGRPSSHECRHCDGTGIEPNDRSRKPRRCPGCGGHRFTPNGRDDGSHFYGNECRGCGREWSEAEVS